MRVCGCVCVVIGVYVVDCVSMFTRFSLLQRVCCKGRDRGFGLQRGAPWYYLRKVGVILQKIMTTYPWKFNKLHLKMTCFFCFFFFFPLLAPVKK
jgi:hypothetical protein